MRSDVLSGAHAAFGVRTLLPDSSTLVEMAGAFHDAARRAHLEKVLDALNAADCALVLTAHHFAELLRHENDAVGRSRLAFLAWLAQRPRVWWLASGPADESLGFVPNVTSLEVRFASAGRSGDAELRQYVLDSLLRKGTAPVSQWADLDSLRPELLKRLERDRELVSIVHATGNSFSTETVGALRKMKGRSLDEVRKRALDGLAGLEDDLVRRGDKKLASHRRTATDFLLSVPGEDMPAAASAMDSLILRAGLDPAQITDDMPFAAVAFLAEFKQKVGIAGAQCGLSAKDVGAVELEQVPTCQIQHHIRLVRVGSGARASGSDLADSYLASLSFYFDVVVVDKRTAELVRQVRGVNGLDRRIGVVERARSFQDLPRIAAAAS